MLTAVEVDTTMTTLTVELAKASEEALELAQSDKELKAEIKALKDERKRVKSDLKTSMERLTQRGSDLEAVRAALSQCREEIVGARQREEEAVKAGAGALFREMDRNKDGKLTRSEIKSFVKESLWGQALIQRDGFKWKHLGMDDTNGDGVLDEAEFLVWYKSGLRPLLEELLLAKKPADSSPATQAAPPY